MPDELKPIPFIDLKAQQARLGAGLRRRMDAVLQHGAYIMGPEIRELESALCDFTGAPIAVSCASGTDALLMALLAWQVKAGDAVFVPSFTFVSTAEVIALIGATPLFVDVREDDFTMDPASLEAGIARARTLGLVPRVVVPVDLFGQPADYPALQAIADHHGLKMLADAAQSFGATLDGRRVGTLGDITATSFFPAKPLGCYGDGGALFTADEALATALRSVRVHGKGTAKYDNVRVGINGRLDTLQAAILLEKLSIFPDEVTARQRVADRYAAGLTAPRFEDRVKVPTLRHGAVSVWAQYTLRLEDRERLAPALKAQGVPTAVYYPKPLHHQEAYVDCPRAEATLPVSERLSRTVISLPMHPYLTEADQARVIAALHAALFDRTPGATRQD